MVVRVDRSKETNEEARKYVPLGVSSGYRWVPPHPIYFSRAKGSKIWGADGNEYADYLLGMGR